MPYYKGENIKKRSVEEIFVATLLDLSVRMDLDKITVRKIVEESGLSQQTFYNYYKNKEDLVFSVHKVYGQSLIDRLNENEDYDLNNLLIDNIKFYQEHKQFILNALKHTKGDNSYFHLSAENAYKSLKEYLLKKNNSSKVLKSFNNSASFSY